MTFKRYPRRRLPTSNGTLPPLPWRPDFNPQAYLHTRQFGVAEGANANKVAVATNADIRQRVANQGASDAKQGRAVYAFPAMATQWTREGSTVRCELSPCDPHHVLGMSIPVTGSLLNVAAVLIDDVIGQATVTECAEGYRLESFVQTQPAPSYRTSRARVL